MPIFTATPLPSPQGFQPFTIAPLKTSYSQHYYCRSMERHNHYNNLLDVSNELRYTYTIY